MTKPAAASGPDVIAIVPAAGEGRRLGGKRKQFRTLAGASLLVQTVRPFDRHPLVREIIVVAPADEVASVEEDLASCQTVTPVTVVAGGATRQQSVGNGLRAVVGADEDPIVLVHDAVRPFVSEEDISAVILSVRQYGAAALAVAVVDTLRLARGDNFGATVSRDNLYRMLTPQGTTAKILREAYEHAEAQGIEATDEVELLQAMGLEVHLVRGNSANMKVTTAADLELARMIWPHWVKGMSAAGGGSS